MDEIKSGSHSLVVLHEAWNKYPPFRIPELSNEDMNLFNFAMTEIKYGRLPKAEKAFNQLLLKYYDNPVLLNNSGNINLLNDKIDQAIAKYNQALAQSPNDCGIYLNMGMACYKAKNHEKCEEYLGKAYAKAGSYSALRQLLD